MRPVYDVAAIAVVGYDSAVRNAYASVAGTVEQQQDPTGLASYVGGVWMIGRVDYSDMRWYNYVFNLFVGINPVDPLKDVSIGLAPTLTGGVSLALGMTLHQQTKLEGLKPGDPAPTTGEIATRTSWAGPAVGAFVGLAIDTNVLAALKSAAGTK